MKKLKVTLCSVIIALWASLATSPSIAGSEDFAGPYISLQLSVMGAELTGEHIDEDGANTDGTVGKVFPLPGGEIGYNIPVNDWAYLTLGAAYNPGRAKTAEGTDFLDSASTTVEISERLVYFIRPAITLSGNSAAFFKIGWDEADIRMSNVDTPPSGLDGMSYAIGTTTLFDSGMFIQTEAGITDYDMIKATGVGGSANAKITADPNMAYGTVSLGYKF